MDTTAAEAPVERAPDHTQLPDEDGAIVHNFQEHPQSLILTGSLEPRIRERFGERFCIGSDCGIYYHATQPPKDGCKAPDWFLVPNVPPLLDGKLRRSYVLWKEMIKPLIVIECVSGDGSEERDTTPNQGKFWVYEQAINAEYYVIFEGEKAEVEVHRLTRPSKYQRLAPNQAGRFLIEPLGVELGVWEGRCINLDAAWLRAWDAATGELLPLDAERAAALLERAESAESLIDDAKKMRDEETERAEDERKRADTAEKRADTAEKRADTAEDRADAAEQARRRLAEKLRELGHDPDEP